MRHHSLPIRLGDLAEDYQTKERELLALVRDQVARIWSLAPSLDDAQRHVDWLVENLRRLPESALED